MPAFSQKSLDHLMTCAAPLQHLFGRVIDVYDCTVIVGHRGETAQREAYRTGASKLDWPNSKHNKVPSRAVDVAVYPIQWNNTKRFYHFAGYVLAIANEMEIALRWGGDWDSDLDLDDQNFFDLVHFELRE